MAVTVTSTIVQRMGFIGGKQARIVDLALTSTYVTNGVPITAGMVELDALEDIFIENPNSGGFLAGVTPSSLDTKYLKLYNPLAAHTHAVALDTGASAAGSSHNHVFTGTTPTTSLNLATPAFSGTGLTAAGQAMTTTDNQTMTLNQCAGMWLIPATGATPPMLILSNTAVTNAPAVLTVQGAAATDAGAYKIVNALAPVGTNAAEATHTHAFGTLADAASGAATAAIGTEIAAGTNLTTTTFRIMAIGY